jgi:hypothetical protein
MPAALLQPTMGTKEVDGWLRPITQLEKLTKEGREGGWRGGLRFEAAQSIEKRVGGGSRRVQGAVGGIVSTTKRGGMDP